METADEQLEQEGISGGVGRSRVLHGDSMGSRKTQEVSRAFYGTSGSVKGIP